VQVPYQGPPAQLIESYDALERETLAPLVSASMRARKSDKLLRHDLEV
jgi:hypothetical protein